MIGVHVMRTIYLSAALALPLLLAAACETSKAAHNDKQIASNSPRNEKAAEEGSSGERYAHVNADTFVIDVIRHPALEGFGRFLLPTSYRMPDEHMRLKEIDPLLPYHSNIDVDTTVKAVNYLIDEVNAWNTVFFDYYTEQEKRDDPEKEDTGLFFFRGRPDAPFGIACPGGGFSYVGSIHEGFPHALELSKKGYNAFVIQYCVGSGQHATEDLAAATSYSGDDPPTFVVVGERDGIASPSTMERRVNALKEAGTVVEFHKYPNLGHGFGLGIGTSAQGWIDDAIGFWERQMSE